jgi:hypothetical protein
MSEDPITRFTLLVLFQAQQDHATELTIPPAGSAPAPIRYKVREKWYDLSPPPEKILPGIVAALSEMAGLTDAPFPREGLIDVPFGGRHLRYAIRIASADAECVLTPV